MAGLRGKRMQTAASCLSKNDIASSSAEHQPNENYFNKIVWKWFFSSYVEHKYQWLIWYNTINMMK